MVPCLRGLELACVEVECVPRPVYGLLVLPKESGGVLGCFEGFGFAFPFPAGRELACMLADLVIGVGISEDGEVSIPILFNADLDRKKPSCFPDDTGRSKSKLPCLIRFTFETVMTLAAADSRPELLRLCCPPLATLSIWTDAITVRDSLA